MSKIEAKYQDLCAQLGDTEYKLGVLSDKKRNLLAEIERLDVVAGALKSEQGAKVPKEMQELLERRRNEDLEKN